MLPTAAEHPTAEQLRLFGQGLLEPGEFVAIEQHLAACESCCALLEDIPPDSFVGRLIAADRSARGTPCDGTSATLVDASEIPPALQNHPRYRVLSLVGQGGMGAVYKAEHRGMQRLVALKVINPGLMQNPTTVARFLQEVRAAARLHHPNIVTAYDAETADDLYFLGMEYVEGKNLGDVVSERGPLPIAEACEYVRQAALGLQHAHECGMVHRDIKPHNLMITREGTVKILDFGLARFSEPVDEGNGQSAIRHATSATGLTTQGTVMGTPDYVAPEQVADSRKADIRSDIYSLGCTLYHLLTGRPPFPGDTDAEKFRHHAETPLPIPDEWPDELKAILRKMTAKKPEDRHATPGEVAEALGHVKSAGASARPTTTRSRSHAQLALALLALVIPIMAAVVIIRIQTDKGEIVIQTDDPNLEIVTRKGGAIVAIRDPKSGQTWELDTKNLTMRDLEHPDGLALEVPWRGKVTIRSGGGKVSVAAGPQDAPPIAEAPDLPLPLDPVERAKRPSAADALRHEDVPEIARAYVGNGDPKNAPPELVAVLGDVRMRCPGGAGRPAFSPDGKRVLTPGGEGFLVFDAATGHPLPPIALPEAYLELFEFGPDQRTLAAVGGDKRVELWDVLTGKRIHQLKADDLASEFSKPVFSFDGKFVAVGSLRAKQVRVWEVATGKLALAWNGPPSPADQEPEHLVNVAFSADGGLVAVACTDDDLRFFERTTEGNFKEVPPERRPRSAGHRVAFSPDGKAMAVHTSADDRIHLCDSQGKTRHTFDTSLCDHLAFTPDGKTLVAARWFVGGRTGWSISHFDVATGKNRTDPEPLQIDPSEQWTVSPDGSTVAVVKQWGYVIRLLDVATGKQRLPEPGPSWVGLDLAFSPDGRWLVSGNSGPVQVWDLTTGRVASTWETYAVEPMVFSEDGKMLALLAGENEVELRSFPEGKRLRSFRGLEKAIRAVAISPDGKRLAAGGEDQAVWVWHVDSGKMERVLHQRAETQALAFSPDGRFLLSSTREEELKIWDLQPGAEGQEPRSVKAWADTLGFMPDGRTVAGIRYDGEVWLRDIITGELKQTLAGPPLVEGDAENGFGNMPQALAPGGRLAAGVTAGGTLVLWEPGSSPVRRRVIRMSAPEERGVRAVAFSPDGRYLAATHPDGIILLLRLAERGKVPELPSYVPDVRELALRPNGADVLKHEDVPEVARKYIGRGDAKEAPPELVAVLGDVRFRCPDTAECPAYSPDGKLLAIPSDHSVQICDASTGCVLRRLSVGSSSVVFGPDSRLLALVGGGYELEVWDAATGERLQQMKLGEKDPDMLLHAPAFSPDGKLIATGCSETDQIRVWEVATGRLRFWWDGRTVDLPRQPVDHVAFSPDGRLLAAIVLANELRFWEVTAEGEFKETKLANDFPAHASLFAFSPDGKLLATWNASKEEVQFFDIKGKLLFRWPVRDCRLLAFNSDSRTVTAIHYVDQAKHAVKRFDVTTGKPLPAEGELFQVDLPGFERSRPWALSPDGRTLAVVEREYDCLVRLIDTETGEFRIKDLGHTHGVYSLSFSPDGKLLAASDRYVTNLWDLVTGRVVHTWQGKLEWPIVFSPDSQVLAIGLRGGPVELRARDGKLLHRLSGPTESVWSLAFSHDGKLLAGGAADEKIWIWRTDDGKMQRVLNQEAITDALAFSPDGRFLIVVTGPQDYTFRVWDLATGEETPAPGKIYESAYTLALLPDGKTVAGLSFDGKVWLRDWKTGTLVEEFPPPGHDEGEKSTPMPLALGPGGRLAAKEDGLGNLVLWQPGSDPLRRRTLDLAPGKGVSAVAISHDGRYVAAGNPDGTICLLRLAERGTVPEKSIQGPHALELAHLPNAADRWQPDWVSEAARAHVGGGDAEKAPDELVTVLGDVRFRCPNWAGRPAFSPDGKLLIVPDGNKRVLLFDASSGMVVHSIPTDAEEAILSPDGKTLAVSTDDSVEIWDVESSRRLHEIIIEDPPMEYSRLAFSPDSKLLAAAAGKSQQVRVWEVKSGMQQLWWNGIKDPDDRLPMGQIAFSADGKMLAATSQYRQPLFWMLQPNGKLEETKLGNGLTVDGAPLIAFSPDGKAIAIWDANKFEIRLCDAKGNLLHTLPATGCNLVAFSTDGSTLVATRDGSGRDYAVQRWEVMTGKTLSEADLPGIKHRTPCVVSPDGKTLAAVRTEYNRVVRLFDVATGRPFIAPPDHERGAWDLAFSPDGQLLASVSNGQVILWRLRSGTVAHSWEDSHGGLGPLAFSPDSKTLAVGLHHGEVGLYATDDGKKLHTLRGPEQPVTEIAFSPDGRLLAAGGQGKTVWLWRTQDGESERILDQQTKTDALAFSPDGLFLISVTGENDYAYRVWDLSTGKDLLASHEVSETARSLAFLPDGKTLAGLRYNGEVWLRDWKSAALVREFPPPEPFDDMKSTPMPLAMGPGGRLAASVDSLGQLLLWEPGSDPLRRRTLRLGDREGSGVTGAAFSPDGRYVAAGKPDGTICLLRLSERGVVPQLAQGPEKDPPPPPEVVLPKKKFDKPLSFATKFPDNLFLVRARLTKVDEINTFGPPPKHHFTIEEVFAGEASLKGKVLAYTALPHPISGPRLPWMEEQQLFLQLVPGIEVLWWIKRPDMRFGLANDFTLPGDPKAEFVPVTKVKELEHFAIEWFPYAKAPPGAVGYLGSQSWEEGLAWARDVERVYQAKSPEERGAILRGLVAEGRPKVAGWALAILCHDVSEEARTDLLDRAAHEALSTENALLLDRMLCRLEQANWYNAPAREPLLRSCLETKDDREFDLACRRLTDAVNNHEIDFPLFAKLLDPLWKKGKVLSEDRQWSLGQTLLNASFQKEMIIQFGTPPKPNPFGALKPEERDEALRWLIGIVANTSSPVIRLHAAAGLKHLRPFSDEEKKTIATVLGREEFGPELHRERDVLLGPAATPDDGNVAVRTARDFVKDFQTSKARFVKGPFYMGGWLVPREKGWELPVAAKSTDAITRLESVMQGRTIPQQMVGMELLDLRPWLTRDPLLKELARTILTEDGSFYVVTFQGYGGEMSFLICVNRGQGTVRGIMPPPQYEPDPMSPTVRETALEFIKAHNAQDKMKLKELVGHRWCHGGKFYFTTGVNKLILYPTPTFGAYADNQALGIRGFAPKFPEKLPETILHVTPFPEQQTALLTPARDMPELDKFMADRGYVVFLGKLGEGGGIALLVKPERVKLEDTKGVLKVVGTLTGLQ